MKRAALLGLLVMASAIACTNETKTVQTLHMHGFKDVRTTGYSWFECGEGDAYHTGFIATNPAGQQVAGTVCCGLWAKGCTVRF